MVLAGLGCASRFPRRVSILSTAVGTAKLGRFIVWFFAAARIVVLPPPWILLLTAHPIRRIVDAVEFVFVQKDPVVAAVLIVDVIEDAHAASFSL